MESYNIDQLREWLELTNQQFDIFKSIYQLESRKEDTTPKNIQKEYAKIYTRGIERSNLFTIIKILSDKDLIQKTERAKYSVNVDGIKRVIDGKDGKFREKYEQFQKASENLKSYLDEVLDKPKKPIIRFLTHHELYTNLSKDLEYAKEYCLTVRAPSLVCSPAFYHMLDRKGYFEMIRKRALDERDLKVRWLSDLNFNMQFDRAVKIFGDENIAYKEIMNQIDRLKNLVSEYENIEFNYIEYPIALKLFITISEKISDCYIYLPGFSSVSSQGAIHIKSEEIASEILKIFNNDCSISIKLNPINVNKVINKSKKILKEHVQIKQKQNR